MSPNGAHSQARQQRELDLEQSLVDLDQCIAEREQVRADRDQQRLDESQIALDADSSAVDDDDFVAVASGKRRQAELGLAQDRSDAHQTQLDDNQRAQDVRRNVLDEQQAPLDHPADTNPSNELSATAEERDRALRRRALAAVARAEQAHLRAVEALQRVEAYERRREAPRHPSGISQLCQES